MKFTAISVTEAESRQGMRQAELVFAQRARQQSDNSRLSLVSSNETIRQQNFSGSPIDEQVAAAAHR